MNSRIKLFLKHRFDGCDKTNINEGEILNCRALSLGIWVLTSGLAFFYKGRVPK